MLQLPGNCRAGQFTVFPKNWKSLKANKNLIWYISYWFYDDTLKKKKQIRIKGMNMLQTLGEKQAAVDLAIKDEIHHMLDRGFNQITKMYSVNIDCEVSEYTPFIDALNYAFNSLDIDTETKRDVKSALKFITEAIQSLRYDRLMISQVKRKYIKFVLDRCGSITHYRDAKGKLVEKKWSANLYNHYRKYLSVLFKQLVEIEAVDVNPVREISKKKQIKKIRETLSKEQRTKVIEHLKVANYPFYRFLQIFFHSGAREVELLRIKKKDVNIINQQYKVLVKKGQSHREEMRTIKTIALPFWNELLDAATPGQYLFSRFLKPGDKLISRYQVTKRWRLYVKEKFGITADMYSLKHSNLDEIAGSMGIQAAQESAGHSTPVITMTYAVGEKERKHNRLKDINNAF